MHRLAAIGSLLPLVAFACHGRDEQGDRAFAVPSATPSAALSSAARDTSILAIIAGPAKFQGEKVAVQGVVRIEKENTAIYASADADRNGDIRKSLWLELSRDPLQYGEFTGRHCTVVGYFESSHGDIGAFPGTIRVIKIADALRSLWRSQVSAGTLAG